jgi:5-methyltetrahydropteroyltriglutamate--homocysteine methyltransferase
VKIETTLAGSYPKLPTAPGDVNLRVVRNRKDAGKATDQDVADAVTATTRRILDLQDRAGIDLPMDGQAGWDDAQTYVARGLEGVRIAGLLRYLDTNTYYRQPEIVGPVRWTQPITAADHRAAQAMSRRPVKAFLPGPYSLYRFSKVLRYGDPAEAARAIGEALAREAASLEEAGAAWIHFEEPWLGRARAEDRNAVEAALRPVLTGRRAKTMIHVPFRAPAAIFDTLAALPWTGIGFDLVEAPDAWDLLKRVPKGRIVGLGLIDARNTRLEDPAAVAAAIARARKERTDLEYQLSPTASLEYLPADTAEKKLERLAASAALAAKGGA